MYLDYVNMLTSLFMSHDNIDTLESNVNAELTTISDWLIANELSLNTKRSNYLIFSQKNKRINQEITKLSNVVL